MRRLLVGATAVFVMVLIVLRHNPMPVVANPAAAPTPPENYLPVLLKAEASATVVATPTPTPAPTPQPPSNTGSVRITYIFYDGYELRSEGDEYVQIENRDQRPIQLAHWTLRDEANKVFDFPVFVMAPGQICRIYTDEVHPAWCGFSFGNGSAIWNNSGDTATLRDSSGTEIDACSYPGGGGDGAGAGC